MNRYMTGEALERGGAQEVRDGDFGWETYQKIISETITSDGDVDDTYNELRFPMAPGEDIEWSLVLMLTGNSVTNGQIKVVVPGDAGGGGFTHIGPQAGGSHITTQYSADQFNTFQGALRGGPSGAILDSFDTHWFTGSVRCGDTPGLLRFQLQGTGFICKAGSLLRVRRAGR